MVRVFAPSVSRETTRTTALLSSSQQTVPAPRYGPWVDQGHSGKWVSKKDVKLRVIAIPQAGACSGAQNAQNAQKMVGS